MKIKLGLALILSAFTISVSAVEMASGRGKIVRVYDGDTFMVESDGAAFASVKAMAWRLTDGGEYPKLRINPTQKTFVVRLGNVDTPESVHRDKSRNSVEGKMASMFAKENFSGSNVSFACWDVGKYGRFICSIKDDKQDFGLQLMAAGHTDYVTCWGKHPYLHKEYSKAAPRVRGCR
jgi:endonuclease YncB( thermonuclease family)